MFVRRFFAALVIAGSGLGFGLGLGLALGLGLGLSTGQAFAQEDLTRGKTPTQLYASDCVDCHKNPRALGRRDNAGRLADFLRVHYTASKESAAAIAGYLVSLGPDTRSATPRAASPAKPRPAAAQEQGKEQGKEQSKSDQGKSAPAAEPAKPAEAAPAKPAEPAAEKPAAPAAEPAPAAPAAAPASPPADPQ